MTVTPLLFIRSLLFNIAFFSWAGISAVLFTPFFLLPTKQVQHVGTWWANVCFWFARVFCGIRYEVRGREYMPSGPAIIASKHQSAWETMVYHVLFSRLVYVLKKELLQFPLWGWYLWRMKMIAINRAAGASSIKQLVRDSKEALADGRPIVIFPEGTRTKPGAAADYHPGVLALYNQLGVPVVPVALNSGMYWGKNAFFKTPGTIIIEFLPPIPPGLGKQEFMNRLKHSIETASDALHEEARTTLSHT
jgi:1-acyl-sn-glycerol-3-phosphate acyltransferase